MHIAINLACYVQFAQAAPWRDEIGIADYPLFGVFLCIVRSLRSDGMTIAK
jgi:hypothetical protein